MEITLEHVLMLLLFVILVRFIMCNCGCNRLVEGATVPETQRKLPACRAEKGEYQVGYIKDIPDKAYTDPCTSDELKDLYHNADYIGDGSITRPYKQSQINFQKEGTTPITYTLAVDETTKKYECTQQFNRHDVKCGSDRYCMGIKDGTAQCYCYDIPKKPDGSLNTNQINHGFYMIVYNPDYKIGWYGLWQEYSILHVQPCSQAGASKNLG